MVTRGTLTR
ncbi:hypothetical protein EYF80_067262 [Liparis tanakae]|uniref:Uncharacterized protein n=1 Tax=Liparis tanakae TaxID=230148 RepID=A0A4Z2E1H4_9TELE|nr:hypothetical protein EYF80_067262 [Liparis tanakae]